MREGFIPDAPFSMNLAQIRTLHVVAQAAVPPKRYPDASENDVYVGVKGNSGRDAVDLHIFSPTDSLAQYPWALRIQEDGTLTAYEPETDKDFVVIGLEWRDKKVRYYRELAAITGEAWEESRS